MVINLRIRILLPRPFGHRPVERVLQAFEAVLEGVESVPGVCVGNGFAVGGEGVSGGLGGLEGVVLGVVVVVLGVRWTWTWAWVWKGWILVLVWVCECRWVV